MNYILPVFASIFSISLVVLFHELGHFTAAKLFGVKIEKFSIGFGKAIYSWYSKTGTQFLLGWIPLGGFVKMAGEEGSAPVPDDQSYFKKPLLQRALIVLAGPVASFLLAILVYWVMFIQGVTLIKPVVGQVIPASIAEKAGIQPNDEIIQIDKQPTPDWQSVIMAVIHHIGEENTMHIVVKSAETATSQTRELPLKGWTLDPTGKVSFIQSLGIIPWHPQIKPQIYQVEKNSPAERAGLKPNDLIVAVDGIRFDDWEKIINYVEKKPDQTVKIQIIRNNQLMKFNIHTTSAKLQNRIVGHLGVIAKLPEWPESHKSQQKYGVFTSAGRGVQEWWTLLQFNWTVFTKMITGKLSYHMLSGPVAIFYTAAKSSQVSWQAYAGFIAFLTTALGFINLFPIPGLDGGHLLFYAIEAVTGRPVPQRVQGALIIIGMAILLALVLQVTVFDLTRLFS